MTRPTLDLTELRRLAEAATPGPWFWWGNTDNHSVALCGRQPGLGVCEVISTLSVERSTTGRVRATNARYLAAASPEVVLGLLDRLGAAEAEVARLDAGRDVERNMLWAAVPKLERLAEVEEQLAAVREWIDHRGVDVGDRDDEYMDGYRAAQRHALQDAAELRRALDGRADS